MFAITTRPTSVKFNMGLGSGTILTLRLVGVTWRAKLIRSEEVKASSEGVTAPGTHLYAKRPPYNIKGVSRNM